MLRDYQGPDLIRTFHTDPAFQLFTRHAPERAKLHAAERVHCERDAAAAFGPMTRPDRCSVAPSQGRMSPPVEELAAIVKPILRRLLARVSLSAAVRQRALETGLSG